ncbi:MAG: Ig-like domain-containing protein [Firmicutes bacterium]|nr:Ig-like domain-containing protein [Bacillota bacterium]
MIGLAYTPVMVPQLENTPVVATAEAATKVKLNKKSAVVRRGATLKLKMQGTKKAVKWSTSDKSIATVSKKGVVTGKKPGKVKITAKVGKKKYVCNHRKNRISADAKNVTFTKANQKKVINVTYVGTKEICYHIDDTNVVAAKWSKKWNGNKTKLTLTAKKTGTTYVRLTNDHNKEVYKIKVTVKAPWENVQVVIPDTIGEQDDPENRMKITFKCVEHGIKGRSNWGEYFYCYDKNGNLLDECYLYAGSLGVGRTFNDTEYIPVGTAKIVFEEYPAGPSADVDDDYYEDAYEFVLTKAPVNLTNGSTLADELKETIDLLATVPSVTDRMDLYSVNVDVAASNVLFAKFRIIYRLALIVISKNGLCQSRMRLTQFIFKDII